MGRTHVGADRDKMLLAASKVQGHLVNKACLYKIPHGSKWG
eukprot:COSAG06_NODE_68014_length_243_cov_15.708333_1_plen_40_part_10